MFLIPAGSYSIVNGRLQRCFARLAGTEQKQLRFQQQLHRFVPVTFQAEGYSLRFVRFVADRQIIYDRFPRFSRSGQLLRI
ncbi:hypothetical protein D3C86_1851130 [compost metagenome]